MQERAVPPDLRDEVERSIGIGRLLYMLDKVSAIATDALFEAVPDARGQGIGGYIPMQDADADGRPARSFLVRFFTRDQPPRAAYDVHVAPGVRPRVETLTPPKENTEPFLALIRARQLAIASLDSVSQPLNPVLLPGQAIGAEGILVYLLAGTTRPNVAVLGRHFRALVSDDGKRLIHMTPLSSAPIEIPMTGPEGARPEALTVTHFVTDFPLETHVFASLLTKLPIFVATRRGVFRVDGDTIAFLGDEGMKEPPAADR